MPYSEDAQPNENRHARKGDARIPAIRSSRSVLGSQHRGYSRGRARGINQSSGRDRGPFGQSGNHSWQQRAHSPQDPGSSQSFRRSGQSNPYWRAPKAQRVQYGGVQSDNGWEGYKLHKARFAAAGDPGPSKHADTCEPEPLLATKALIPLEGVDFEATAPGPIRQDLAQSIAPQREDRLIAPELPRPRSPRPPWPYDPQHPSLSISLARRFFPSHLPDVAAIPGSSTVASQPSQVDATSQDTVASPPHISNAMALSADGPAHRAVGHGAAANSNEPEDVTIDLPHNDYNPEAEIIDMLEDPGTTLDVERDVVIDKPYNKAVRWGCWSVLSSPPKIRSGTLVLSLSAPNSESSRETPEPLLASREYSVLDVSHSPPSPSIAQSVSLRDVSNVDADEEESRTTGRHNQARVVQLRKDTHDKPRRLLALPDSRGQLSVTMRGSLDLLEGPHSRHVLELMASPPTEASRQAVDDACILSSFEAPVVVLGHARNSKQLSLVRLEGRRGKVMGTFDRPAQSEKNGGISAVCVMMQPGMFATGGYDHAVHLWSLPSNGPPTPSGPLAIKHTSVVQSLLAIRDTSRKLVTASADCSVNLFDLPSERVVNCLKLSNSVYQVHPGPSEFCTLLEVAHRELQFEVRDYRLVPIAPVVRFGYRSSKVHGRYVRGAVENHLFASGGGEKDGCVRLWDLRKPSEILQTVPCLPGRKVIQVLFGNEQLVACAEDHHLAFMNRIGDLVAETGNL